LATPGISTGYFDEVAPLEEDLARGDLVARLADEHVRERALARAVGSHHGVDLARSEGQVDSLQDRYAVGAGVEVVDFDQILG
jgi:hypothetical protein